MRNAIMAGLLSIVLQFNKVTLTSFISLLRMVLILKHKAMVAREHCIRRPILVTCLSFKNSYQDIMLISMRERIMGEQLCGWLDMAILTHTLQSLPFLNQMVVYRVIIYSHLTLNPLHISLIINSLSSTSNDYTKVKKLIKLKSNLFSLKQTLSYTFNHTLSFVCVSQIFIISKKN